MRKLLVVLFLLPVLVWADVLTGKVVSVHDGDTITVLDSIKKQHRIRLSGIDAPELSQAYGRRSRDHLTGLVASRNVQVEWQKHDKYRRVVGKVQVNGRDVNLEQLQAGFAWHYKKYESEQAYDDRKLYADAEQSARARGIGLWHDKNAVPPWEFRRQRANHDR